MPSRSGEGWLPHVSCYGAFCGEGPGGRTGIQTRIAARVGLPHVKYGTAVRVASRQRCWPAIPAG